MTNSKKVIISSSRKNVISFKRKLKKILIGKNSNLYATESLQKNLILFYEIGLGNYVYICGVLENTLKLVSFILLLNIFEWARNMV
jgi:hypothetical protein